MEAALIFPHRLYHPKLEPRRFLSQEELDTAEKEEPGWKDSPTKCTSLTKKLAERLIPEHRIKKGKYTRQKLYSIKDFDELTRIAKNRRLVTERDARQIGRKDLIEMILEYQEQELQKK